MMINFGEQQKPVMGHLCLRGYQYHFPKDGIFLKTWVSGETSPVIKLLIVLLIKSKKNNNVNVSSSKRSDFGTEMVKNIFMNYRLSYEGRTFILSVTCPPLVKL